MYGCNFIGNSASEDAISGCWTSGFRMAADSASVDSVPVPVAPQTSAKVEKSQSDGNFTLILPSEKLL